MRYCKPALRFKSDFNTVMSSELPVHLLDYKYDMHLTCEEVYIAPKVEKIVVDCAKSYKPNRLFLLTLSIPLAVCVRLA